MNAGQHAHMRKGRRRGQHRRHHRNGPLRELIDFLQLLGILAVLSAICYGGFYYWFSHNSGPSDELINIPATLTKDQNGLYSERRVAELLYRARGDVPRSTPP